MATADDLSDDENWTGGFYELLLVLGPADDARLDRAVRSLWRFAGVREGPVGPSAAALHEHGHLRGSLTLPSGDRVVCGGYASRYEDVDTLELYLPLGALARVDRRIGAFPFDERSGAESLIWRAPLDRWLVQVAGAVHAEVPFRRALIGFEVDEDADTAAEPRYATVLVPGPSGLEHHPATT